MKKYPLNCLRLNSQLERKTFTLQATIILVSNQPSRDVKLDMRLRISSSKNTTTWENPKVNDLDLQM